MDGIPGSEKKEKKKKNVLTVEVNWPICPLKKKRKKKKKGKNRWAE